MCVRLHISNTKRPNFTTFSAAVARSSADGSAISYVLPVLWMTSLFHIIERMGRNQRRRVCFVQFARWRRQSDARKGCLVEFARVSAPGAKSTFCSCTLVTSWSETADFARAYNKAARLVTQSKLIACYQLRASRHRSDRR